MEVQKHRVWDIKNLDEFRKQLLEEVFLKKEVPSDLKEQLSTIEKLMVHCYFEYAFIDVAMLQAIIVLEKALKVRYVELGNVLDRKTNFEDLIDWALEKRLFEDPNPDVYHNLRKIRNRKVHNPENSTGGLLYLKGVYKIFDFINDLYEDVDLRVKRWEETKILHNTFENKFPNGLIFNAQEKRWIGYKVVPSFLNNKKRKPELSLSLSQIFDPNSYGMTNGKPDNCLEVTVTDWKFTDTGFTALDIESKQEFKINYITDSVNLEKYLNWRLACEEGGNLAIMYFEAYEKHGFTKKLREMHRS